MSGGEISIPLIGTESPENVTSSTFLELPLASTQQSSFSPNPSESGQLFDPHSKPV